MNLESEIHQAKRDLLCHSKLKGALLEYVRNYSLDNFSQELHRNILQFVGLVVLNVDGLEARIRNLKEKL